MTSEKKRKIDPSNIGQTTLFSLTLQKYIDEAKTPEELHKLISEFNNAADSAHTKLIGLDTVAIEDLVDLVESNQSQRQTKDICARSVDATFAIGPKKHILTISFDNENDEGEETIRVETELFILEEGDFSGFEDEDLDKFFTESGIKIFKSERYNGNDQRLAKRWVYGDIINTIVKKIEAKHGVQDSCGVTLGLDVDNIYELLELK